MKMAKEKELMELQIQLLQEQQKLIQDENKVTPDNENENESKVSEESKTEKKETCFPDPTAEQIKELQEEPKNLEIKKTD